MPRIRQFSNIRYEPVTLLEDVDISTYDRLGKLGSDGLAALCGAGEKPEFIFTESGSEGDTVAVAFFGGAGGQMQLKMSGSGQKGEHIKAGDDGVIVTSSTDSGQPISDTQNEIGVVLDSFNDGEAAECNVFRV